MLSDDTVQMDTLIPPLPIFPSQDKKKKSPKSRMSSRAASRVGGSQSRVDGTQRIAKPLNHPDDQWYINV